MGIPVTKEDLKAKEPAPEYQLVMPDTQLRKGWRGEKLYFAKGNSDPRADGHVRRFCWWMVCLVLLAGAKPYIENAHQLTKRVASELLKSCWESAEVILQGNVKLLNLVKEIFKNTISNLQEDTGMILTTLVECHYEFVNLEHPQFRDSAHKYLGVQQRFMPVQGWFMNISNQESDSSSADSFLTLQENDSKSPSSDSDLSDPVISRETKIHNTSKQKRRFFTKSATESKFYDTENFEMTSQKQET